jgi:hypothetical protein
MRFIEHIHEPNRLLLVWQGMEGTSRDRRVVAEIDRCAGGTARFRYVRDSEDFRQACEEGFLNFPAFRKVDQAEYRLGVVETFMRRLPPRSRGDYAQYLEQFRLHPQTLISDFALLGYTGAKLPSDGFSLVDPLDDLRGRCDLMVEVAGFRHVSTIEASDITPGMSARLTPEPDNPRDPNAVAVYIADCKVGYIPRPQTRAIHDALKQGSVGTTVERVNGRPDRPLVYLFTQIDMPEELRHLG